MAQIKCVVSFLCQPLAVGAVRFLPAFFLTAETELDKWRL